MKRATTAALHRPVLAGLSRRLWPVGAFLASVTVYAFFLQRFVLAHYPGGIDFYTVWKAAQALFLFHRDPYSQQVTQEIQQAIYGHTLTTPQGEYLFVYPLYFLVLIFPLAWLPFASALAWWLAFLQIGSLVVLLLLLNHYQLGQRPLTKAVYLLWGFLLYPSMVAFWVGQPVILVFLLFALAWYAFCRERDWLAGVCLGLALIKPYVILLPLCFLLIYALSRRRFKVVLGCAGVAAGLLAISFLIWPPWLGGFLANSAAWVNQTEALSHDVSALQLLTDLPGAPLSSVFLVGAILLLSLALLIVWARAVKSKEEPPELALVLTMLFQAFVLPHQHAPNQILLLIPCFFVLAALSKRRSYLLLWLTVVSAFLIPWLIRILIADPFAGDHWIIVPIPLLLALMLLLMSQHWIKGKQDAFQIKGGP